MALPIRFRNVHYYRIAGKYIFAGDLFISRGQLYFFPETDLEEQRTDAGWSQRNFRYETQCDR